MLWTEDAKKKTQSQHDTKHGPVLRGVGLKNLPVGVKDFQSHQKIKDFSKTIKNPHVIAFLQERLESRTLLFAKRPLFFGLRLRGISLSNLYEEAIGGCSGWGEFLSERNDLQRSQRRNMLKLTFVCLGGLDTSFFSNMFESC